MCQGGTFSPLSLSLFSCHLLTNTPKMSSRRFTAEEASSYILNWDSDAEEEISETEDNVIDDPDCQFSDNEEDSEDECEKKGQVK